MATGSAWNPEVTPRMAYWLLLLALAVVNMFAWVVVVANGC